MGLSEEIACVSQYLNLNRSHSKQISIWSQSHLSQLVFDILKENYRLLSVWQLEPASTCLAEHTALSYLFLILLQYLTPTSGPSLSQISEHRSQPPGSGRATSRRNFTQNLSAGMEVYN